MIHNIRKYGLYKGEQTIISDKIIDTLSDLPFSYKGDYQNVEIVLNDIKDLYPTYINFINQYFVKEKKIFFLMDL